MIWCTREARSAASSDLVKRCQRILQRLQVIGQIGSEQHFFARCRMLNAKFGRVQGLPP